MNDVVQTERLKDIILILDYIDESREELAEQGLNLSIFDKLHYEEQFIKLVAAQFFECLSDDIRTSVGLNRIPLRILYYNLIEFMVDVQREIGLNEISLLEEYSEQIFVHLTLAIHNGLDESYNFTKVMQWLNMTTGNLKKRKVKSKKPSTTNDKKQS
tara:strand:- start:1177 stop:1650 length:474 start_codon:yes stop_codon:yes gene_type:complete